MKAPDPTPNGESFLHSDGYRPVVIGNPDSLPHGCELADSANTDNWCAVVNVGCLGSSACRSRAVLITGIETPHPPLPLVGSMATNELPGERTAPDRQSPHVEIVDRREALRKIGAFLMGPDFDMLAVEDTGPEELAA